MKISIIQPCFVPWLGYFEQIAVADVFVYMDDVQYTKKDWRNTNQLKTQNGIKRIFVPVKKPSRCTRINEAVISHDEKWQEILLNKIKAWYKKSLYFKEIMSLIDPIILSHFEKLVDFNFALNNALLSYLEISTPIYFSSQVPRNTNDKNLRIIEICNHFNADILYDGKSAADFIDTDLFQRSGIEVYFQNYQHRPYRQLWGDFVPYMSVLDLLMNEGKRSREIILSSPLPDRMQRA